MEREREKEREIERKGERERDRELHWWTVKWSDHHSMRTTIASCGWVWVCICVWVGQSMCPYVGICMCLHVCVCISGGGACGWYRTLCILSGFWTLVSNTTTHLHLVPNVLSDFHTNIWGTTLFLMETGFLELSPNYRRFVVAVPYNEICRISLRLL